MLGVKELHIVWLSRILRVGRNLFVIHDIVRYLYLHSF